METPFTFALGVLGCRANQEEIDALRSALLARGGAEVSYPGPAELVILNSCAVTAAAQAQSRRALRRALRRKSGGWVVVTGCAAQLDPRSLAELPGVDLVSGNREKSRLLEILTQLGFPGGRPGGGDAWVRCGADPTLDCFLSREGPVPPVRARALLKIQDGCPLRCSYCVVSTLRGSPVSRAPAEVEGEVRRLIASGFAEIVLTGINLGLYGWQPEERFADRDLRAGGRRGRALAALLRRLERLPGRFRIRLSSLEPMTIDAELLDAIAASARVCRHLHLAIQSGDDGVLSRMGRPYDRESLLTLVGEIRARMPDCGLGADLIAGFPGESAGAFARTLSLARDLRLTYLHAFPYSERPGTAGARLSDPVPEGMRKQRVRALRRLDGELRGEFARRLSGRLGEVLIETIRAGRFRGLGGEYVRLEGPADEACAPRRLRSVVTGRAVAGELCDCRLVRADEQGAPRGGS